jgi:hypothetical protein
MLEGSGLRLCLVVLQNGAAIVRWHFDALM